MIISEDKSKYLSAWRFVELAKYIPSLDRVIRQKDGDNPILIDVSDIEKFRTENNNVGLYTSIWNYNDQFNIDKAIRFGPLYFDIDNEDLNISHFECTKLYLHLCKNIPKESISIFFTGKKGFHIECDPVTIGINPSNNLPNIYRWIATSLNEKLKLTSLDFSVYDARRMWRLEGSQHQSTGLYKTLIDQELLFSEFSKIEEYSSIRHINEYSVGTFDPQANEWFREFTYDLEIEKERSKDFIAYFNKHGSSVFKDLSEEKKKIFTPDNLLKNCPAIADLKQQAKDKKWLDHEARLFLCSILSYTDDSINFLHEILSNCEDYNVEKSNSHINDWIKRRQLGIGGRPFTCERANSAGVGCGECSLEKKKKWIKIGNKYVESEEESPPSPIRFAYTSIEKGGE